METRYNGNFSLLEIKRITKRFCGLNQIYEISFVDDKRKMYISDLTAFVTENKEAKLITELKLSDKIWIDIVFTRDGTLK